MPVLQKRSRLWYGKPFYKGEGPYRRESQTGFVSFACDLAIVASNFKSIDSRQVGGLEIVFPRNTLDWSWQVAWDLDQVSSNATT
jgi:hypothetical protein